MKFFLIITFLLFCSNLIAANKRNVLIFMAADNDLEEYALNNLNEIEGTFPTNSIEQIVVQTHLKSHSFNTNLTKNSAIVEKQSPLINPNEQLNEFLIKNIKKNQENVLILWGHGQGPRKKNSTKNFGGLFTSSVNYPPLSTEELGTILNGKNISMLIFDMCLMQNLQVITDLKNSVEIIIASAQIQNLIGLPYEKILNAFDKEKNLEQVAKEIVFHTSNNMPNKNFTISAIYSGVNYQLAEKLNELNKLLNAFLQTDPYFEFIYSNYFIDLPNFPGGYYDLGMYLGILKKLEYENNIFSKKINSQINNVLDELVFALIEKSFGSEYTEFNRPYYIEFFQGISITKEMMVLPNL